MADKTKPKNIQNSTNTNKNITNLEKDVKRVQQEKYE